MSHRSLGVEEIVRGLRELGVALGDALVVHSSLSSFGYVRGGAAALLQALREAVGPQGTLLVPTMTFERCAMPQEQAEPFDPASTSCDRGMGRLPELLRRQPEALRSTHPLLSVAALGPLAAELTEVQTLEEPYAPYRRLAELGGSVLLLGVGHTRNSTVHAAEYLAGRPYAAGQSSLPWWALVLSPRGPRTITLRSIAGCSEGFDRLDGLLPERRALIGACQARLVAAQAVLDVAVALFRSEPAPFLCRQSECNWCAGMRARLARQAPGVSLI